MTETDVPKYVLVPRPQGGKAKNLNPEYVALWEPYLADGMSAKDVAHVFGVNERSVRKAYPDKVWNRQQILEHSRLVKALNRV